MMTEWTYLKKGDKRPMGRVLVAHGWPDAEWKLRAAIFGDADAAVVVEVCPAVEVVLR